MGEGERELMMELMGLLEPADEVALSSVLKLRPPADTATTTPLLWGDRSAAVLVAVFIVLALASLLLLSEVGVSVVVTVVSVLAFLAHTRFSAELQVG